VSAVAPARSRLSNPVLLGMVSFIASESFFFGSIVIAYIALRHQGLASAKAELDVARTAVFSLLLFTAALGAAFLAGQALEYARLLSTGIAPSTGAFGTTFFTLTGLHGLHVLAGLGAIAMLTITVRRSGSRVRATAWDAVAWYWHFVDGVWVVVFSVVYLGTVLG
jgi:heme/copper-type cytochrome/quinol oxidase subunit 3